MDESTVWFIDRIEEGVAVLVREGRVRHLAVDLLPPEAQEGTAVHLAEEAGGDVLRATLAPGPSARALDESARQLQRLRRSDPGGDLEG